MKTLTTLFFLLFVSLASASNDTNTKSVEVETTKEIVISTKGVKKLEDIKIETINKTTYLELMLSSKKNKNVKTC